MADSKRTEGVVGVIPPPPTSTPGAPPRPAPAAARSTVRATWGWMWKDTLVRVLPFFAASGAYAWLTHDARRRNVVPTGSLYRDVLAGVALGLPMAAVAAGFRRWVAPRYQLPTPADQALQTAYYFAINAPAEELFWRGTVQTLAIDALALAPGLSRAARPLGWALATAVFGAYHRLGHWSWRAIGGVTLAGGFFGLLHLMRPRRGSLLLPTIVHGFATAGFLSWGDVVLDLLHRKRA